VTAGAYGLGIPAAYWFIERTAVAFGVWHNGWLPSCGRA
jgi:hypothetical protein